MRYLIIIFSFCLLSFSDKKTIRYEQVFSDDYADAKKFLKTNFDELEIAAYKFRHNMLFSNAIVFPELMRYSVLKDILETSALEIMYVEYGKKAADFSIGRFQMKASFIESLEEEIIKNDSLLKVYGVIIMDKNRNEREKRQIRVNRLKTNKWQITYLHTFIAICDERFKSFKPENINQKLVLYSTAYNSGFYQKPEILLEKSENRCFPYGQKFEGTQYSYSDISNYYFSYNH